MTHKEYSEWKYRSIFENRSDERLVKIAQHAAGQATQSVGGITLAEAEEYLSRREQLSARYMWAARAVVHSSPGSKFCSYTAVSDAADCLWYKIHKPSLQIMTELVEAALS